MVSCYSIFEDSFWRVLCKPSAGVQEKTALVAAAYTLTLQVVGEPLKKMFLFQTANIQKKWNNKLIQQRKFIFSSHHHVENHHQHEANGKTNRAEVRMLALAGFGNEFLHHNIEHSACGKSQHVGQDGCHHRG